jgi:hypothetical protein
VVLNRLKGYLEVTRYKILLDITGSPNNKIKSIYNKYLILLLSLVPLTDTGVCLSMSDLINPPIKGHMQMILCHDLYHPMKRVLR